MEGDAMTTHQLLAIAAFGLIAYLAILVGRVWRSRTTVEEFEANERRAVIGIYMRLYSEAVHARDLERQRTIRREALLRGIDLDEAIADALRNEE